MIRSTRVLQHLFGQRNDVAIFAGIDAYQRQGDTLAETLYENQLQQVGERQIPGGKEYVCWNNLLNSIKLIPMSLELPPAFCRSPNRASNF